MTHAEAPGNSRMAEGAHAVVQASVPDTCDHGDGCGGHVEHADQTCASGAVTGTPALPTLQPSLPDGASRPEASAHAADSGSAVSRAPPSLAELQLLRI
ncbi:DUF6153 family protein [Streptomyces sp. NPDC059479]|uniref:DUF6153 family protein n=1 Tax=Streptomyces sp. NPDC059479 TaxID=3346848 RepID=UPI0036AAED57